MTIQKVSNRLVEGKSPYLLQQACLNIHESQFGGAYEHIYKAIET